MAGKSLPAKYDGYTSCPLVISPKECILAEFDFQAPPQPLETLPINQAKPRRLSYMIFGVTSLSMAFKNLLTFLPSKNGLFFQLLNFWRVQGSALEFDISVF